MVRGAPHLACIALLLVALRAGAANVSCAEPLGEERIDGNLAVDGACELIGTEVRGNVTVAAGASLAASDAWIRGNLRATGATFVELRATVVDGNARFERTVGASSISDTGVSGNVEIFGSQSLWELTDNSFGGNVEITANAGGVALDGNVVRGKLECDNNVPAPVGARNEIRNGARGQCAALQLESAAPVPRPADKPEQGKPSEAKPDPKAAPKPEPKPDSKPEPKPDAKPEPKAPEPKPEPPNAPEPRPSSPAPAPSPVQSAPPAVPVSPAPRAPEPTPSGPAPAFTEAPPPQSTQSSFTPEPGGGGGGAVGILELMWLPLAFALRGLRYRRRDLKRPI